jgi:lysophospholipase L1-like esterase
MRALVLLLLMPSLAWAQAMLRYPGDRPGSTGAALEIVQVACLGDSLTEVGGTGTTTPYPSALNVLLGVGRWNVVNHGLSGDTVAQMRTRWTNSIRGAKAWRFLVFLGGVNDLRGAGTAAATFATASSIFDEARADGIIVVILTMTPWKAASSFAWTSGKQAQTEAYNALLLNYCTTYPSQTRCRDTYDALNDAVDPALLASAYDSGDGIHVKQAGADAIAAQAKLAISP